MIAAMANIPVASAKADGAAGFSAGAGIGFAGEEQGIAVSATTSFLGATVRGSFATDTAIRRPRYRHGRRPGDFRDRERRAAAASSCQATREGGRQESGRG